MLQSLHEAAARGADDDAEGTLFFLKKRGGTWQRVTIDVWMSVEREAGFSKMGDGTGPATGGFAGGDWDGRTVSKTADPSDYDWDPAFANAMREAQALLSTAS